MLKLFSINPYVMYPQSTSAISERLTIDGKPLTTVNSKLCDRDLRQVCAIEV